MSPLEIEVDCFKNSKSKDVIGILPVSEWVNKIKEGFKTDVVLNARESKENKVIARAVLPAIAFCLNFKKRRSRNRVIKQTGLQNYVVNCKEFDIDSVDLTKVFLIYKGYTGNHYNIVVRVDNMDKDNAGYSREYIAEDLGIVNLLRDNIARYPQVSIFSYDPNIFINEYCIPYDCSLIPIPKPIPEPKIIYTYFIRNNINNLIKIGKSSNIDKRIKAITGQVNFVKLTLESYIQGDYERTLHKFYSEHRREGEWFEIQNPPTQMDAMILHNLYSNFQLTDRQLVNVFNTPVRYDNLSDTEGTVIICKLPDNMITLDRGRKRSLFQKYTQNLFLLNPNVHLYKIHSILSSLNTLYLKDYFSKDCLMDIVEKALYKSLGKDRFDYTFTYR